MKNKAKVTITKSDGSFISGGIVVLKDKEGKLNPVLEGTEEKYLKMGWTIVEPN